MFTYKGTSVKEFFRRFPDEYACLHQVFESKWGRSGFCPECKQAGGNWYHCRGTKQYQHRCRARLSPLKDTAFYRSNISLMAWFYGLLLFTNCPTGMRAAFMRRHLGIGSNGAHRLCHQIRLHLASQQRTESLGGPGKRVHVDEVFLRVVVDPALDRRRLSTVLGLACDGKVITGVVPDRKAATIRSAINRFVLPGSTIVTDAARQYAWLAVEGWDHVVINHKIAFHNFDGITNNPIERYWSVLRRMLRLYRQVSDTNLWTFLAEAEFRYNRRHSEVSVFDEVIENFPELSPRTMPILRARFDWT
ncbi:MAG: IS1595 family transposase [Sphingomonadales bacterium]|nr:IS1595 family transposase [Sphingomonadales bacterium]NCQ22665.1 IS1595 family transposase [Sphingomonadales bacterium]NCT04863.1 IS1595 family transposase [Sphingomonadales bacterium]